MVIFNWKTVEKPTDQWVVVLREERSRNVVTLFSAKRHIKIGTLFIWRFYMGLRKTGDFHLATRLPGSSGLPQI
jgi:hypothetical protein